MKLVIFVFGNYFILWRGMAPQPSPPHQLIIFHFPLKNVDKCLCLLRGVTYKFCLHDCNTAMKMKGGISDYWFQASMDYLQADTHSLGQYVFMVFVSIDFMGHRLNVHTSKIQIK